MAVWTLYLCILWTVCLCVRTMKLLDTSSWQILWLLKDWNHLQCAELFTENPGQICGGFSPSISVGQLASIQICIWGCDLSVQRANPLAKCHWSSQTLEAYFCISLQKYSISMVARPCNVFPLASIPRGFPAFLSSKTLNCLVSVSCPAFNSGYQALIPMKLLWLSLLDILGQ